MLKLAGPIKFTNIYTGIKHISALTKLYAISKFSIAKESKQFMLEAEGRPCAYVGFLGGS